MTHNGEVTCPYCSAHYVFRANCPGSPLIPTGPCPAQGPRSGSTVDESPDRRPSWIGDTVITQPLFVRLHERIPNLELHALARAGGPGAAARMPQVAGVIDSPFGHGQLSLKARWSLARELAAMNFDRVYVLPNSLKSALIPFMAGIPERIGFTGESRVGLINTRHTLDKAALPEMAERFAQLAEPVGAPCRARSHCRNSPRRGNNRRPALPARRRAPGETRHLLPRCRIRPGQALADATLRNTGPGTRRAATPSGRSARRRMPRSATRSPRRPARNLCGKTSLHQAIDLIAAADVVVCNDSGLMHVAAAPGGR